MTPAALQQRSHEDYRRRGTARHLRLLGSDVPALHGAVATPLIERTVELDVLGAAASRLAQGRGGVVLLEASAGLGKTALLEQVERRASRAGCLVRRAAPGPLERHFPFGVVRALLEAPLRDVSEAERARLLDGAAAAAGALLLDGTVAGGDVTMQIAHSVLWLLSAMGDDRPLALVVDDAHWADRPSLEVLAYLARRIDDLPLLIAVAARSDDPDGPSDLLSLLGGVRSATVLHPQPLTPAGAVSLIRRLAPAAPLGLCRSCHRAVAGNPWLLGELGRQIAAHGPAALDATEAQAPPVSAVARNVVRRRLAALTPRDRAVVEAIAVIGEGAPDHVVAMVAGVPLDQLGIARDALVAAGLLDPAGTRFAHHMIATAIGEDLPPARCEHLHRATAHALMAVRADADVVASHLLRCGPEADPVVSGLLVRAAAAASERGAPHTAAAYLERALSERAPDDDRGRMLSQLAMVAFDAGLPDSRRRLREALQEDGDRDSRIDVLTRLAALNVVDIDDPELSQLLERELAADPDPQTRAAIEAAALDALITIPHRHEERARRLAAIELDALEDPVLRRTILAHRAWLGTERGTPDAAACAALAREALAGRRAAARCVAALGLPPRHARARAHRSRRRGAAGDRPPARPRRPARVAAPARGRLLVRGRPRPAHGPRGRRRERGADGPRPRRRRRQRAHGRCGGRARLRPRRAR